MNKSLLVYRNNQRKSKTRLALCIRVFGLVAITSFYLLASTLERSDTNKQPDQGACVRVVWVCVMCDWRLESILQFRPFYTFLVVSQQMRIS